MTIVTKFFKNYRKRYREFDRYLNKLDQKAIKEENKQCTQ